ncbi:MAG: hypothetical protein JWN24_3418 [Phycisphaerales bacterium]|nr:hypothetical protein [Phycisphaerales bacterium]
MEKFPLFSRDGKFFPTRLPAGFRRPSVTDHSKATMPPAGRNVNLIGRATFNEINAPHDTKSQVAMQGLAALS